MPPVNFDTRRPITASEDGKSGIGGAYRLVEVELSDMGQVLEAMMEVDMAYKGVDAVVHLAAIPCEYRKIEGMPHLTVRKAPGQTSSSKQFGTNTMATYNILEAARKCGIKKCVAIKFGANRSHATSQCGPSQLRDAQRYSFRSRIPPNNGRQAL